MEQNSDPSAVQKVHPVVTLAPVSGSQVTKLIFTNNTALANHSGPSNMSSTVGTPSILLASPTKTLTISKNIVAPHQILKPAPGTPTKQTVFVLPPMKSTQRFPNVSGTIKSPIRIAPATSVPYQTLLTSKVAVPATVASNSTLAKTVMVHQSPKKVLVKPHMTSVNTGSPVSSNLASVLNSLSSAPVVQVSSSSVTSHQVQVPGSKLHYVRLVSAPGSTATTPAMLKQATAPMLSASSATTTIVSSVTTVATPTNAQIKMSIPVGSIGNSRQIIANRTVQKSLAPASAVGQIRPAQVSSGQVNQISPSALIPLGNAGQSYVVVPASYITQVQSSGVPSSNQMVIQNIQNLNLVSPTPAVTSPSEVEPRSILPVAVSTSEPTATRTFVPIAPSSNAHSSPARPPSPPPIPPSRFLNGRISMASCDSRPRKPCNCTKSQCLKLYCECFANGEFCNSCNCNNCYNNLEHEIERQKAIKACLDRNPMAFHPKIGKSQGTDRERRHTKGCNCRRSGCLKNYCECYEAKILCTNLCRCISCKNFEDSSEKKTLLHLADAAEVRVQQQAAATTNLSSQILCLPELPQCSRRGALPSSFITDDVLQVTVECLMAQAHTAESHCMSNVETEKLILEEFGRCLKNLISFSNNVEEMDSDSEVNV